MLGKEVKNAEMKALQAQINPHFLYNTLELINLMALRNNVPEISEIIQTLAKFYKLSLSQGKNVISIEDEISHIETYVKLQNFRFKNKINLVLNVDENLYNYSIMKLVLQPIIENSILHGILEKEKQTGVITVNVKLNDNSIHFSIEDDGIGMTAEQTAKLLEIDKNELKTKQGYGIKNVNHRIKLYYGNEYGLSYTSSPHQGTKVDIIILAQKLSDSSL
jgi:two-component system sensor histidine kinase YesM